MSRYDIRANLWRMFQHNPSTISNTSIKRIKHAQSIMIEASDKAFVIGGVDDDNINSNEMLIYDFKQQTWDHMRIGWEWSHGVVNHLAFDDPSGGYILGFAGQARMVNKPWH